MIFVIDWPVMFIKLAERYGWTYEEMAKMALAEIIYIYEGLP